MTTTSLFYDDDVESGLATVRPSIFLAGPTARGVLRTPWRAEALERLAACGFGGAAVIPEFRSEVFATAAPRVFGHGASPVPHLRATSYHVLRWETAGIERSTIVLFWMPFRVGAVDDPASLPGFTTRAEVSREVARDPTRVVLGMPPGAASGSHIRYHAHAAGLEVHATLEATVRAAVDAVARRAGRG